jgi:predicted N-acyltransferase
VFDWAWADAFHRHKLAYYPKLLTAVPYSPVTGPRLLTHREHPDKAGLRQGLVKLAMEECERAGFSSWHCNFVSATDSLALETPELLARSDWQFHWRNTGYTSFEDFLNSLQSRKRKNILRERRGVAAAGIRFEWKTGAEIDAEDIGFIYRCYTGTFDAHGNHAALNQAFFTGLARSLNERFLVCFARSADEPVASSVFLKGGGRLYGRYWGCVQNIPGLHFDAAYYQGIEYCIHHGIEVFESGAQGEHKIARGFLPCKTRSFHYVRHPAFSSAIADFLARESIWLDDYRDELLQHSPYRRPES